MKKSDKPSARMYHTLIYDTQADQILLFGGQSYHHWGMDLQDSWAYDMAKERWKNLGILKPGGIYAAAYHERSGRVVMLNMKGETWAYCCSTGGWEKMNPLESPGRRCGHKMVYDRSSNQIILFGGFKCTNMEDPLLNDTWAYDYEADKWALMTSETSPPARIYHAMVYHPVAQRTIVWGGRPAADKADTDLWLYDYQSNTWTSVEQSSGPSCRYAYPAMVFSPESNQIIMFGGLELYSDFEGRLIGETWLYDLDQNHWTRVANDKHPEPRSHHAMEYSTRNNKAVLFSGEIGSAYSDQITDDLWIFDPISNAWESVD